MLTNLHYDDYDKPYVVKDEPGARAYERISTMDINGIPASAPHTKVCLMNRAFKSPVIDFAQSLSTRINGLREAAIQLDHSINRFLDSQWFDAFGDIKNWLKFDLERFVEAYNQACDFACGQDSSEALLLYAARLRGALSAGHDISRHRKKISKPFLTVDNQRSLVFHDEAYQSLDFSSIANRLMALRPLVAHTLMETVAILEEPLTIHMNFKDLGCYYTYMFGTIKDNPFRLIDNGILFNMAI